MSANTANRARGYYDLNDDNIAEFDDTAILEENATTYEDELKQSFAELSLAVAPGQFPASIIVVPGGTTRIEKLRIADIIADTVKRSIRGWAGYAPRLAYSSSALKRNLPLHPSVDEDIESSLSKVLSVESLLSDNTAQGTVYRVRIDPNPELITPRTSYGEAHVDAVMKKSPIYNVGTWKQATILSTIAALSANELNDWRDHTSRNHNRLIAIVKDIFGRSVDSRRVANLFLSNSTKELPKHKASLTNQYSDINNEAYVDAIGYVLTSALAERSISPFFALCYGCLRGYDSAYFSEKEVGLYGPAINTQFPVQLTFLQALDGDTDTLEKSWLRGGPVKGRGTADRLSGSRLLSFWAQTVFGLSALQALLGGANNDFHSGNILFEHVPEDTVLYYVERQFGQPANRDRHLLSRKDVVYAVPTYGVVLKMIDFGRSSFDVGNTVVENTIHSRIFPNYDNRLGSADMVRAAACFYRTYGRDFMSLARFYAARTPEWYVSELIKSVVQCGLDMSENHCTISDTDAWAYSKGSTCVNGVPGTLFGYFETLRVDVGQVPDDHLVYPIWRTTFDPLKSK